MKPGASAAFLRDTQALFAAGSVAGLEDEQLLARFSAGLGVVSELAFAGLVSRHGPMVLATCRRTLGDLHQADDAFQATFLVLAKRARTVRGRSLGPWLYGVARKVCRKARGDRDRRAQRDARPVPRTTTAIDPTDLAHQAELRDLIDRELARIPARLREAIVLCDLQGLSHDEAARRLGCPAGTIKSRQARGRARLRERLEKLGLDPAAVASPSAIVSARLASATASAALNFQIGGLIEAGVGPASVALSLSTLRELSMIHLFKITAAAAAGLGTLAVAAAVQEPAAVPAPAAAAAAVPAPAQAPAQAQAQAPAPAQADSRNPTAPQPAAAATVSAGIHTIGAPQVDRLQSLEQKLDRVLNALERAARRDEPRNAPESMPTEPTTNPFQPGFMTRPVQIPRPSSTPNQPTQDRTFAGSTRSAPSLEARLNALEHRVNQMEKTTKDRLEILEGLLDNLQLRVPAAASRRKFQNDIVPLDPNAVELPSRVRSRKVPNDDVEEAPVADDLPLQPNDLDDAPLFGRRAPR